LPAATPETTPVLEPTVACEVLPLTHVPPDIALAIVMELPAQKATLPVIAGTGIGQKINTVPFAGNAQPVLNVVCVAVADSLAST